MKATVVFLVGIAISLTGAFIRSCQTIPDELLQAWCGSPPQPFALALHQHCAGCGLAASGLVIVAISPLLISWTREAAVRAVSMG